MANNKIRVLKTSPDTHFVSTGVHPFAGESGKNLLERLKHTCTLSEWKTMLFRSIHEKILIEEAN